MPGFSPFYQLAWVTRDLKRSMDDFRELYNVPSFFVMEPEFDADFDGVSGKIALRIAFAFVDDVQLELIQAHESPVARLYNEALPANGSHANVFHHVCVKIPGPVEAWDAHMASLPPQRRVCYRGDSGPDVRFAYTDERALCGLCVEHFWCGPDTEAFMLLSIPQFYSKAAS